ALCSKLMDSCKPGEPLEFAFSSVRKFISRCQPATASFKTLAGLEPVLNCRARLMFRIIWIWLWIGDVHSGRVELRGGQRPTLAWNFRAFDGNCAPESTK